MARAHENGAVDSPVRVTRGLGDSKVRVLENNTVVHEGEERVGGDEFVCDTPLAQNLALQGHVEILGAA